MAAGRQYEVCPWAAADYSRGLRTINYTRGRARASGPSGAPQGPETDAKDVYTETTGENKRATGTEGSASRPEGVGGVARVGTRARETKV